MDLTVLNKNFESVAILDALISTIWTDRFVGYGDFEIYTPVSRDLMSVLFNKGYYLINPKSEHVMIIEGVEISTDVEDGSKLIITGRSLESILERRVVWDQTILSGNFQNGIQRLLTDAIINPSDSNRRISNFIFEASTDSAITGLSVDTQFTGDTLLDAIDSLCTEANIGYKITLNSSNQFVFKLYSGEDISYDQGAKPYVVFSPSFENFVNGNYLENDSTYRSVALIVGEDQAQNRKKQTVYANASVDVSGLDRRELFVDARDISYRKEDGTDMTDAEYNVLLQGRGNEKLAENIVTKSFEGEVDFEAMYTYGDDFYMGDIVQIVNEFGIEAKGRITEVVFSETSDSITTVPTFTIVS